MKRHEHGENCHRQSIGFADYIAANNDSYHSKEQSCPEKIVIDDNQSKTCDIDAPTVVQDETRGSTRSDNTEVNGVVSEKLMSLPHRTESELPGHETKTQKRVLMLQGPIGPFFKNLQYSLEKAGYLTKRVLFHKADELFAPKDNVFTFRGDLPAWERWVRYEMNYTMPDIIVLFGSSRPAHMVARRLADEFGIKIIALEEGYLRSGYITCEIGGNNSHSPLKNWEYDEINNSPNEPLKIACSFKMMCLWGAIFYLWRELTKNNTEQYLYHRNTKGAIQETCLWTAHTMRRSIARVVDSRSISYLKKNNKNGFIFVPLQTPSDAQIRYSSRGWSNEKLVTACLEALKNSGSTEVLVFKTHPLDEMSHILKSRIMYEADKLGLADKIHVLRSGKVSELTLHCSGMIVINSASAFSALHHNVPILALGDAIYSHPSIVTTGNDNSAIREFFNSRSAKDPKFIASFVKAVRSTALIPGDFYALSPQAITARNVVSIIECNWADNFASQV